MHRKNWSKHDLRIALREDISMKEKLQIAVNFLAGQTAFAFVIGITGLIAI